MIKILLAAYAVDQCAAGNDSLSNDIYVRCSWMNDVCPSLTTSCSPLTEDLSVAIAEMLEQSDNNRTMEVEERYGRASINTFADQIGLSTTQINHRIGCGWYDQPRNQFNLEDAGLLYEYITDGTLFSSYWENQLFLMNSDYGGNGEAITGRVSTIIAEERANTSLTDEEVLAFRQNCAAMDKGGSYGWPTSQGSSFSYVHKTAGGWCKLPFKAQLAGNWTIVPREYVLGTYVNDSVAGPGLSPNPSIAYDAYHDIIREQVREALQSWDNACSTPAISNQPDPTTVTQGDSTTISLSIGIGTGNRSYQWWRLVGNTWNSLSNTLGRYSGVTTNTLQVITADEADETMYRCVVSSDCGNVTSNSVLLTVNPPSGCDSIDFNGDGLFPDTQDIADFITVFGGGACPTGAGQCGDIDFNNDGLFPDTDDISTFVRVFSGGPCA